MLTFLWEGLGLRSALEVSEQLWVKIVRLLMQQST